MWHEPKWAVPGGWGFDLLKNLIVCWSTISKSGFGGLASVVVSTIAFTADLIGVAVEAFDLISVVVVIDGLFFRPYERVIPSSGLFAVDFFSIESRDLFNSFNKSWPGADDTACIFDRDFDSDIETDRTYNKINLRIQKNGF